MSDLLKIIRNPLLIIPFLGNKGLFNFLSDKIYLKLVFRIKMGYKLNLDKPITFNEKLQWLKLYNRNTSHNNNVDKYEVRKLISKIVGDEYLIPLLGVWDNFDEIDFDKLPNKFVLKCTHDSGGVVICLDKSNFNYNKAKKRITKSLNRNYYWSWREFPYKNVKPRIICEQLIENKDGTLPSDYKFHCFNGQPDNVMICLGRETGTTKYYFFNEQWQLLRYNYWGLNASENFTIEKPENIQKMFDIARQLSKDEKFVRVDLYNVHGKIYFGELTYFPQSGFDPNLLKSTDILFGNKIIL